MTVAGFIKGRVGSILAGGIRSARHPFVLEQASRELHHVCCFKPEVRRIIYQEIYNNGAEAVAGSRLLCAAVKERMEGFEKQLDGQIAILKRIEGDIQDAYSTSGLEPTSPLPHRIRKGEVTPSPLQSKEAPSVYRREGTGKAGAESKLPAFVKQREAAVAAPQPTRSVPSWRQRAMALLLMYSHGKHLLGLYIAYIRSLHLRQQQVPLWLVEGISCLIVNSYSEDSHGQTRFGIADVLCTLTDVLFKLREVHARPRVPVSHLAAQMRLEGSSEDPIMLVLHRQVEAIVDRFEGCISGLNLSTRCKEQLRQLDLLRE